MTVIASALKSYEGVLCASSGHINVHETGAVEYTGHKVLALDSHDGKISARQVEEACRLHESDPDMEHTVKPGMVYISFPSEYGTLYSGSELKALRAVCNKYHLLLYVDGARLGYGLMAEGNDLSLADISAMSDVFYIGGTKVGALFGEAVVINNRFLADGFRYHMKQKGGMLAKGRLLGIQFLQLFSDGLYFRISEHADVQAMKIKEALKGKGYDFAFDSPTNQQFPVLPDGHLKKLEEKYSFSFRNKVGNDRSVIRICTSWATHDDAITSLISDISAL
jgi:threonine aldolase